jgi:hypothetical protein
MTSLAPIWSVIAQFLMQQIQPIGAIAAFGLGVWIIVTPNKHHIIPKAIGIVLGLLVALYGSSIVAMIRTASGGQMIIQ